MNRKNMFRMKAALSIALLIDFIIVLVTGIMLYLGTSPANIGRLHTITGMIMGAIASIHIVINFRFLMAEIHGKIECTPKNMMRKK